MTCKNLVDLLENFKQTKGQDNIIKKRIFYDQIYDIFAE